MHSSLNPPRQRGQGRSRYIMRRRRRHMRDTLIARADFDPLSNQQPLLRSCIKREHRCECATKYSMRGKAFRLGRHRPDRTCAHMAHDLRRMCYDRRRVLNDSQHGPIERVINKSGLFIGAHTHTRKQAARADRRHTTRLNCRLTSTHLFIHPQ